MIRTLFLTICLLLGANSATSAEELPFPIPSTLSEQIARPAASLRIATAGWTAASGTPQSSIDGLVIQSAYRLDGATLSTRDLMVFLRDHLLAQGFASVFECETASCGGFDFRYDLTILPEPAMHVDLGDFRYFSGTRLLTSGAEEAVALIVSRSANAGFVQFDRVIAGPTDGGEGGARVPTNSTPTPGVPAAEPPIAPIDNGAVAPIIRVGARLETGGAIALDDLIFGSGSATLAEGDYASLAELAAYLMANPGRQIALVGHTDASGGLDANITLSRRRAESVRQALISAYDVPANQVLAEGVGFLAPRASNLTDAGRAANRRVEAMLTNTE